VAKGTLDSGKTVSRIDVLNARARVEEVARMLGGLEITETTRKHARELLAS
jgi:DNA repair protein RecN (Recombination protein N)